MTSLDQLKTFDSDDLTVVIETPKGSQNKYTYEPSVGAFVLTGVLPAGAVFPFDFGFVPSTLGEDGDPLDVLVLMDAPAFAGCVEDTDGRISTFDRQSLESAACECDATRRNISTV